MTYSDSSYGMIEGEDVKGYSWVDDYQPPAWLDTGAAKRFHLDLHVEVLDALISAPKERGPSLPRLQRCGDRGSALDPAANPSASVQKRPDALGTR